MGSTPNTPGHDRGYSGEQDMGFFLGEQGYFFIEGPSGSGGHKVTNSGFDGVGFHPEKQRLIIYDNKSWKDSRGVDKASAIDKNLIQNLDSVIAKLEKTQDVPKRSEILDLLKRTRTAAQTKSPLPPNVTIAVSNAGGRSTRVSERLRTAGVSFLDYYQAPQAARRSAARDQNVAALIGTALGDCIQWLGDKGIEREVRRRLEGELAPSIRNILARGDGVLIVIALQEWETPDFQGRRARNLLSVYVHGGPDEERARQSWEEMPKMMQGPPKGWRTVTQYKWIPPRG